MSYARVIRHLDVLWSGEERALHVAVLVANDSQLFHARVLEVLAIADDRPAVLGCPLVD